MPNEHDLELENKKLTTRVKSLTTRNRNLSIEVKRLATENQRLESENALLTSGEEYQAMKLYSEQLTAENDRLRSENNALSAGQDSLSSDLKKAKRDAEQFTQKLGNLEIERDRELRIRRIASRSLALVLMLCLALGFYVSSRFSDLEETFNDRISEAEERIEEAESRATLAERRANKEKTRADNAETRLEEFLPSESDDDLAQADSNYIIALYTLRAAEQQGLLKEHLQYLESCGVDISVPPYSDFAAKIEPDEPSTQDTASTTGGTTGKTSSETSGDRLPSSGTSSVGDGSTGGSTTTGSTSGIIVDPPTTGDVVYITESGKKYHLGHCSYLAKSKIEIDRDEAISQGYTPCSRCGP